MLPYHVIIITCCIKKMAVGKILFTIILVKSGLSNLQNSALIFLECQKGLIVNNEIWFAARLFRWISLILQVCSSRSEKISDERHGSYSSVRKKCNIPCIRCRGRPDFGLQTCCFKWHRKDLTDYIKSNYMLFNVKIIRNDQWSQSSIINMSMHPPF